MRRLGKVARPTKSTKTQTKPRPEGVAKGKPWRHAGGRPSYLPLAGFDQIHAERMARRKGTDFPYFNPRAKCFMRSVRNAGGLPREERLTGLSGPLAEHFYPDYRLPAGESGGGGREGGRRVHHQLACHFHLPDYEATDPLAKRVIHALASKNLEVEQCEFAAAYGAMGTAADLILRDARTQQLYVAELKTGMRHAFLGHELRDEARLRGGLEKYSSCPMHHALLQVIATRLMLHDTYPGRRFEPMVILAHDEGVEFYHGTDGQGSFTDTQLRDFGTQVAAWLREVGRK